MTKGKKAETRDPLDALRRKASREAVRYAVQRAIECPECGGILDYRRAVLITPKGRGAGITCAGCFRRVENQLIEAAAAGGERLAAAVSNIAELIRDNALDDGRHPGEPLKALYLAPGTALGDGVRAALEG